MSDIVERLKYCAEHGIFDAARAGMVAGYDEVAAEIIRLQREIELLKKAVMFFAGNEDWINQASLERFFGDTK